MAKIRDFKLIGQKQSTKKTLPIPIGALIEELRPVARDENALEKRDTSIRTAL